MNWIRTQTNQPREDLVNMEQANAIVVDDYEATTGIFATFDNALPVLLTYFDGDEAEALCLRAHYELWAAIQAGVRHIDMRDICQYALEWAEEDER